MNYSETLDWMFAKLPMYQRQGTVAFKKNLDNTLALAKHLKQPHLKFKSIHVAGTNGKGSTSHMLASILQEAGYNVGLYTSPHLKDFRERIKINGRPISEQKVTNFVEEHREFLEKQSLSFFEMTVGLAFDCFADEQVDIAVVEVGLGGRLDSTNIINPLVSVITNIGYDHTQMLGDTLGEIAREKAGIIKHKTPVVISEKQEEVFTVFSEIAEKKEATLYVAEDLIEDAYETDLHGWYQQKNLIAAVQTIRLIQTLNFNITEEQITNGLLQVIKNTGLLGRYQVLQEEPKVICDTAHNKEGLTEVLAQIKNEKFLDMHVVLGVVNDKNLEDVLPLFPKEAFYYFCRPNIPRGLDANSLAETAAKYSLQGNVYGSVSDALEASLDQAQKKDLIYVGGSTFVVSEVV